MVENLKIPITGLKLDLYVASLKERVDVENLKIPITGVHSIPNFATIPNFAILWGWVGFIN